MSRPPSTAETIRELIEKTRRKQLPNRVELVGVALQLALDAREYVREYTTKKGEQRSKPDPNFNAANKAVEVAAALALKIPAAEEPRVPVIQEDPDALIDVARQELSARGYDVVPRVRQ